MSQEPPVAIRQARWALLCCTLAVYAWSLNAPFQFDDRGVILRDESVHSLSGAFGSLDRLRPLLKLSYAASWALGGGAPIWFHAFNVLIHLLNVELVLRLYTAATSREARWPFRSPLTPGALLAGVFFALHPIQTEAVTYVSGRSSSLSTCFVLLSLLLYAEGVRSRRKRYWLGYCSLAFAGAVATKETSAVLPLGLMLWELGIERSTAKAALKHAAPWLGLALIACVALIMHPRYFALLYGVIGQRSALDALVFQLGGVAYLAERLSLLAPLCIDPGLWLERPTALRAAVAGATCLLVTGLAVWKGERAVSFGVAWFLLHLFVPFLLLPRTDVINERHAYVANVGLSLAFAALATRAFASRGGRLRGVLASALAVSLALLSFRRNLDYQSEVKLWQSTVRVAPGNPRAHNNLGVAYELAGRSVEARIAYAKALRLAPGYAAARDNLRRSHGLRPAG